MAEEDRVEEEADKIEEAHARVNVDWAEEEERKELEEAKKAAGAPITKDDEKWMKEQLAQDKEKFGEDFGDDIDMSFED